MKKIIISGVLIVIVGFILLTCGLAIAGFNPSNIVDKDYVRKDKYFDAHESIDISGDSANIIIHRYNEEEIYIDYFETVYFKVEFEIKDHQIKLKVKEKWYQSFFYSTLELFSDKNHDINVYIPETVKEAKLSVSTGNIKLENMDFDNLELKSTTGNITAKNINTPSIKVTATTGNIRVENVVTNYFKASITTGNATLTNINTQTIEATGSTGNITMKNITALDLTGRVSTGNFKLLDSEIQTKVDISLSTGNLTITNVKETDFKLKASTGNIKATIIGSEENFSLSITKSTGYANKSTTIRQGAPYNLEASCSTGSIKIYFV